MDDAERNKLRFRAWRRGFREADLILGPFADRHVPTMTADELATFETLLDQLDHDLYAWIVGRAPTPPEFDNEIMRKIKDFRYEALDQRGENLGA
ncbi:MAG: succinate dehydrogenase assembly factor 2 [Caulobacterales bacterium 68-7]|mgnify:FL=1|nr:succinate dehydrogenase assembly factor 2 [Caulobacterales bacterium]OJU09563.1 MAG: succinate dehydrogenase assembly factor 2 [Caulobacterales bacterium 68-7]